MDSGQTREIRVVRKCTPATPDTTTRKPLLLFRLSGVFLLRLAERQFVGLLFHDPPRSTRRHFGPAPQGPRGAKLTFSILRRAGATPPHPKKSKG